MSARIVSPCLTLCFLVGCGGKPMPEFPDDPDQVVIFSVDGNILATRAEERLRELDVQGKVPSAPQDEKPKEELYGWPILGKVEITGADQQQKVVNAAKEAIRDGPDQAARCFIPRHVIRVVKGDETVDLVICFECYRYRVYRNGTHEEGRERTISRSAQEYLDKLLTDAGVPLASKSH